MPWYLTMQLLRTRHVRTIAEPSQDGGPGDSNTRHDPEEPDPTATHEYTQAQIDEIVAKRVARVKKQYGDYEDMKKKAAKLDEIEAANKSELEKLTDQNQKLAAQLAEREHAALIQAACIKHGVPADYMDLVTGADEESIDKAAEKVAKLASASTKPPKGPSGTEGNHPSGNGAPDIDAQIRAAEGKGDYLTSLRLKSLKLSTKQ